MHSVKQEPGEAKMREHRLLYAGFYCILVPHEIKMIMNDVEMKKKGRRF